MAQESIQKKLTSMKKRVADAEAVMKSKLVFEELQRDVQESRAEVVHLMMQQGKTKWEA